jgi:hypothetical protein
MLFEQTPHVLRRRGYPAFRAPLIVKTVLAISAVMVVLALVFFRLESETGPMALQRCRSAVGQAKSWTVESTEQYGTSLVNGTTRYKISCPDDYEYFHKTRTPDNVFSEQSTVHTNGVSYVEDVEGKWAKSATVVDSPAQKQCGKGPLVVQQTVFNAIVELPRRREGKMVKGELQSINGGSCRDWSVDYGNEWPQTAPYTVCIDPKTHLPRRITFTESGATNDFTGWNSTKIEPPPL